MSDSHIHALGQQRELPMASGGCTLDDSSLATQLARYRRLGASTVTVEEHDLGLAVTFGDEVDVDLVHETLAIERGCCTFFTLDYDPSWRRLSIAIDDPARAGALRSLLSALTDSTGPSG